MLKKIIFTLFAILSFNSQAEKSIEGIEFSMYKSFLGFHFDKLPENYSIILQGKMDSYPVDIKSQFFKKDRIRYFNFVSESTFNNLKHKELLPIDKEYKEDNKGKKHYYTICYKKQCTKISRDLSNEPLILSINSEYEKNHYYTIDIVYSNHYIYNIKLTSNFNNKNFQFERSNLVTLFDFGDFKIN